MDEASCSSTGDIYDRSFVDDSDDDSYSPESVKENKPKRLSSNEHGVVLQENDIVISMSNKSYKDIVNSDLERFVQMREIGQKPNANQASDEIMECLRKMMQKGGGRYLIMKKNPSRYVEIGEDEARDKIKESLMDESRRQFKRRSNDLYTNQSPSKAKRVKMNQFQQSHGKERRSSYDMNLPSNSDKPRVDQARPKRATQQIRDDMFYRETLDNTSNAIGKDVGYAENASFKLKRIAANDKKYCIGQMIAKELVELKGHRWAVKYCQVNAGEWKFVTFRDCSNSNAKMANAVEGRADDGPAKFTGYDKLCDFILKNGLLDTLIKDAGKVNEAIKKFDMMKSNPRMSGVERVAASFRSSETNQTLSIRPLNECSREQAGESGSPFTKASNRSAKGMNFRSTIMIAEQVMQVNRLIKENLCTAEAKLNNNRHKWKYNKTVAFYLGIQKGLARQLKDQPNLEYFESKENQDIIELFETAMAELIDVEMNYNDISEVEVKKNLVKFLVNQVQMS